LQVRSALDGVGLTAAVSTILAEAGINGNMVEATHRDHVFVPAGHGEAAVNLLQNLSAAALGRLTAAHPSLMPPDTTPTSG